MTPDVVREQLLRVDGLLNKSKPVEEPDKKILLTVLYREFGWGGPKPTPLPKAAIDALGIEDRTGDGRWSNHFVNNSRDLGLYRTRVGFYWLLWFDARTTDHVLEHAGTAADLAKRFGK
ncbi:MAG: hypothetical protein K8H88_01550 [Sandaracinaceae bacterium]|nr:hypothetical protein [Sandaracinaceae bacterium]